MPSIYKRLNFYYKINKISGKLLLPKSSDPFVSSTWVVVNTGNWFASNAIANTEPRLALKKIMGSIYIPEIQAKNSYSYRKVLLKGHQKAHEEKLLACAVQHQLQCQWAK